LLKNCFQQRNQYLAEHEGALLVPGGKRDHFKKI